MRRMTTDERGPYTRLWVPTQKNTYLAPSNKITAVMAPKVASRHGIELFGTARYTSKNTKNVTNGGTTANNVLIKIELSSLSSWLDAVYSPVTSVAMRNRPLIVMEKRKRAMIPPAKDSSASAAPTSWRC